MAVLVPAQVEKLSRKKKKIDKVEVQPQNKADRPAQVYFTKQPHHGKVDLILHQTHKVQRDASKQSCKAEGLIKIKPKIKMTKSTRQPSKDSQRSHKS